MSSTCFPANNCRESAERSRWLENEAVLNCEIFPLAAPNTCLAKSPPRKTLNILEFGLIEEKAVKRTRDKIMRLAVVLVTIAAWFSISNHCALGALTAAKTDSALAPMHCHGNQPAPSKKSSEEETPCCKMLRATITSEAKIVEVASKDFTPIQDWIVAELVFSAETQLSPLELDSGPPFAGSFAESVLQRSILAHAPPVSLS